MSVSRNQQVLNHQRTKITYAELKLKEGNNPPCPNSAEKLCPSVTEFKNLRSNKALVRHYLKIRSSKTANSILCLKSRDGSTGINTKADKELMNYLSNLQAHDDEEIMDARTDKFRNEQKHQELQYDKIGDEPGDTTAVSQENKTMAHWPLRVKKGHVKEEFQKSVDELFYRLSLGLVGQKTIMVNAPIVSLTFKEKDLIKRGFFHTATLEGRVRVVDGDWPPADFHAERIEDPQDIKARPPNTTVDDYIYIRHQLNYWHIKNLSGQGVEMPEIPYGAITILFRYGYKLHLKHERIIDEEAAGPSNEESLQRATERLELVEEWENEDPKGMYTSLMEYLAERKLHDLRAHVMSNVSNSSPSSTPGRLSGDEDSHQDRVESPKLNRFPQNQEEIKVDSNLDVPNQVVPAAEVQSFKLSHAQLAHLIERKYKDEPYSDDAWEWKTEILKLRPDLKVCIKCGNANHDTARGCRLREDRSDDESREENYFQPAAASLAALNKRGYICPYPYCKVRSVHDIRACPGLHQRCDRCRCRGHGSQTYTSPKDGKIYADCPEVAAALNEEKPNSASSPSYSQLLAAFEGHAGTGIMTQWRYNVAAAGFFPALGEGDASILSAVGYKWLLAVETNHAVSLLHKINRLCADTFTIEGRKSLQYEEIQDQDWNHIWKERAILDNKRREERRREERPAKMARRDSTPPRHSSHDRSNSGPSRNRNSPPPVRHQHARYSPHEAMDRSPAPREAHDSRDRHHPHRHSFHSTLERNPLPRDIQDGRYRHPSGRGRIPTGHHNPRIMDGRGRRN